MWYIVMSRIPRHIAVIPDGNRRYSRRHLFSGYKHSGESLQRLLTWSLSKGVQELSIFAWSSENWSRPVGEITEAMGQFEKALDQWLDKKQSKIGYYFISTSPHKLKPTIRNKMHQLTTQTDNNRTLKVYIYVSYGFSEETLCTTIPTFMTEPELLIRTSGEQRLSNFCMWHLRYTELMFIKPLFPECNEEVWDSCLEEYSTRKRRFGK